MKNLQNSKLAKKKSESLLGPWEKKLINYCVPYVPDWLETYHLTLLTILWSGLIVWFGFLAKTNINWLWASSLMFVFQYITDALDGAVGRYRQTGLIKWGFHMDHFLDYIFLCAIFSNYANLISPKYYLDLIFLLIVFIGFMMNSYLAFTATNEFKVSFLKIGPTEARILFIIFNTAIIFWGKNTIEKLIPGALLISALSLIIVVYRSQRYIWRMDMKNKLQNTDANVQALDKFEDNIKKLI